MALLSIVEKGIQREIGHQLKGLHIVHIHLVQTAVVTGEKLHSIINFRIFIHFLGIGSHPNPEFGIGQFFSNCLIWSQSPFRATTPRIYRIYILHRVLILTIKHTCFVWMLVPDAQVGFSTRDSLYNALITILQIPAVNIGIARFHIWIIHIDSVLAEPVARDKRRRLTPGN